MNYKETLKALCDMNAVSGSEESLSNYIEKLFSKNCCQTYIDKFNNVIGLKNGVNTANTNKKVLLTAHIDEIGMIVKKIDENGFIRFICIGGIDAKILPAQEVIVHGEKEIIGVIGAKPPHLISKKEYANPLTVDNLYIDTGFTKEEIENVLSIGDVITFRNKFLELKNGMVASKSLDNRAGVCALVGILDQITRFSHSYDIVFAATTMEEFNLGGAVNTAYNIKPDCAIIIDTCHASMHGVSSEETFATGKGPVIGVGPQLHKKYSRKIIEIAKKLNIPHQIGVESGHSGTEAWATQVSREGIPTILLSIPVKYMHTPIETASIEDIEKIVLLVVNFLSLMTEEMEGELCF